MHGWLTHLQHSFHIKFKYLILTKSEHCHDNTKQTFPSLNEKVTNTFKESISQKCLNTVTLNLFLVGLKVGKLTCLYEQTF